MAWNEPGKGQDPWGGGKKSSGGPPDLDQIWRRFRARFSRRGGNGGDGGGSGGSGGLSAGLLIILAAIALVVWLASGLYIVQPGEKGVLLRFGAYTQTVNPGWHWHLPYPIDRVYRVDTQQVRRASNRAVMLTKDENIVEVEVSVQYRISDAMKYLFKLRDPDATVEQVLRSAVREIVGTSTMNQVIQEGLKVSQLDDSAVKNVNMQQNSAQPKSQNPLKDVDKKTASKIKKQLSNYPQISSRSRAKLPDNVRKIMQATLSSYNAGIKILAVNVQYAQPPEQVQGAFQEAIKAREEEERKKNIARAYARDILARAQGEKAQTLAQARGYEQKKIARAKGDASRFSELLTQYQKAPQVTRERLYLETMGDVLSASHLILDDGGTNSMMYLPLQQMLKQGGKQNKAVEKAANDGVDTSDQLDVPMAPGGSGNGSSNKSSDNLRSRNRN